VAYLHALRGLLSSTRKSDVVVAPPFTAIQAASTAARDSDIGIAGQNLHWERDGAFTGEITAGMLREAGATHVIIGHSERRTLFGETDQTVNRKLIAALGAQLIPIVCVGETLAQRDANQTLGVLDRQVKDGLETITGDQLAALVVAYEPVWAIGTGRTATAAQAQEAHAHIRGRLRQWFGAGPAERCRILYGGSVKPENAAALGAEADVDGALVGGASLDPKAFAEIVRLIY
ncbi:MAG TPA: triose-phosphate isomerase, partial [Vicinamibacterales bacterium]|nr:triose-phosphate isomerase [Vicinamibacterales bacterium]